jgi:hypothetical protein
MSDDDKPQKPFDHPDYQIGNGAFNFSKWVRENVQQPEPRFKVGDIIVKMEIVEITKIGKDCDGSTLYYFDGENSGSGDYGDLRTLDEMKDFICTRCQSPTMRDGKCGICD